MSSPSATNAPLPVRVFDGWLGMIRHMMAPTAFFFVGFNLILWTMHLALARHGIDVVGFATATVAALLVGKAVLLTDRLPFMTRFDGAPLIQPILFKSAIYWMCALLVLIVDILLHYAIENGGLGGFIPHLVENFDWRRFAAVQVWLMVLFSLYVTLHELGLLFGGGELYRLFFRWHTTEAKLARRSRIRLLVRLNRLTEANSIEAIGERGSSPHVELIRILRALSSPSHARRQGVAD